jgi:hypothetical protein
MRNRARVLSLIVTLAAMASFLRAQCANIPAGGGMLGPNPANGDAPAFMDSDGSGGPSCGDIPIVPQRNGDTFTIPNPYQNCDGSGNNDNSFFLLRDKGGTPIQLYRDREPNETEILTPTAFFLPGEPSAGHLDVQRAGLTVQSGDGMLVPGGGGFFGGVSGMQTFGGNTSAAMSFVYQGQGGGGGPAYISLPWSQLESLGLLHTMCSTPVPQTFIPLSNGRIVLDLDGDGVPDPDVFSSPPLTRQSAGGFGIPTVSRGTMALLAAALVGAGLFQLRRGGLGF